MEITSKIKDQYEYEKELANMLRNSTQEERKTLYGSVYDAYFSRYPNASASSHSIENEFHVIKKFLNSKYTFLEIGTGDGHFARMVSPHVKDIHTIDVLSEGVQPTFSEANISYSSFNGVNAVLPENQYDIAYSNQIFEHIHPDDIDTHLQYIKNSLKKGGQYIIITPHAYCGPHDISKHVDIDPTGFHLKEYTYKEIVALAKKNGFSTWTPYYQRNRFSFRFPKWMIATFEYIGGKLPRPLRKFVGRIKLPMIMIVLKK